MFKDRKRKRRLVVFAHYNSSSKVFNYVFHYLNALIDVSDKIVFVSASPIVGNYLQKLKALDLQVIIRPNVGYDFGSWKDGLQSVDNLQTYDEVILCNDSCWAPISSFQKMFSLIDDKNDFWAPTHNEEIGYHLQSYFLVFRKNVFISESWNKFWGEVGVNLKKEDIIHMFEVGLTTRFLEDGFTCSSVLEQTALYKWHRNKNSFIGKIRTVTHKIFHLKPFVQSHTINYTHRKWALLLFAGIPFLKIQLVRDNPLRISLHWLKPVLFLYRYSYKQFIDEVVEKK